MVVPGLDLLFKRMRAVNVLRCIGHVQAFGKPLEFAFLADTFDLLLSTVGQEMPLYLNKHVTQQDDCFTVDGYLGDDYKRWKEYFGLRSSGDEKFSLKAILEKIGPQIATLDLSKPPNHTDILKISRYQTDKEGIYFMGLRHNPPPKKTSKENYKKTCIAFGKEVAVRLRANNISTCWSANSSDESKKSISEWMADIQFF